MARYSLYLDTAKVVIGQADPFSRHAELPTNDCDVYGKNVNKLV